jgi:glutathione S-transferase
VVTESAAIALYLAEKAGKLMPRDLAGRTRVVQWCFAAVSTVAPTLISLDLIGMFDPDKDAKRLHEEVPKIAGRWLEGVERRLEDREWIACADFTMADLMMASVLRYIRNGDLMQPFPKLTAYYERCHTRPAWQRTLELYAERVGVKVDDIR